MQNVLIRHTAELDDAALGGRAGVCCDGAFEGDFADADWEHALGGVHALCFEGDRLVAHAALVVRRLLHGGSALRTGYVEAVRRTSDAMRWVAFANSAERGTRSHGTGPHRVRPPQLASRPRLNWR